LRLIPAPADRRVRVGRVSVNPESRGQGLARTLMKTALARCRLDYPGWQISLSAQLYLTPFYEDLGFRPTSEPYDDHGVPHVDMAMSRSSDAG